MEHTLNNASDSDQFVALNEYKLLVTLNCGSGYAVYRDISYCYNFECHGGAGFGSTWCFKEEVPFTRLLALGRAIELLDLI